MLATLLLLFALVAFVPASPATGGGFAAAQELPPQQQLQALPAPAAAEDTTLQRGALSADDEGKRRQEGDEDAPEPSLATAAGKGTPGLNCSTVEGLIGGMTNVTLFTQLAKFSGLEEMVVPGGVFHEVVGDLSVFAPEDEALRREIDFFAEVFNVSNADVMRDQPLLQEILRQFVAYGDVSIGYRGLFVTLDGSVWNWTDAAPDDGVSEIALVPAGLQLEQAPAVLEVDEAAGTLSGCSRGMRLSGINRSRRTMRRAIRRARTVNWLGGR